MNARRPQGIWLGRIARAPLLTIIVVVSLGIVAVLATQLIRAPGITLALSVEARAMELRLDSTGTVIRDISGSRVSANLDEDDRDGPESVNLLEAVPGDARRFKLEALDDASIKLEALLVPGGSLIELSHDARGPALDISLPRTGIESQARIGWEGHVAVDATGDLIPTGAQSVLLAFDQLNLTLSEPQYPASLAAPFTVQGIRLEEVNDGAIGTYPISTILGGRLQFFSYGVPLPERTLEPGVLIRFAALSAEVTNLAGDPTALRLRLYGTAQDMQLGFGSRLRSIYPSAFEGLGALPSVRVGLSTIFGILIAMIGAVGIQAAKDPPEQDQPLPSELQEPVGEPMPAAEADDIDAAEGEVNAVRLEIKE